MTRKPHTPETLRDEIDHGQAADKVDFPDPAAVPLGADDEASGHPVTPEQVSEAEAQELDRSAGETGEPADMDYYRTTEKTGAKLTLSTMALPLLLLLLVILGAIWAYS